MSAETGQACQFSSARRDTLFHDNAMPARDHVEQITFVLAAPVDAKAFASAWRKLGERHAILRMGFHAAEGGQVEQSPDAICHPLVDVRDWRDEPESAREEHLQRYLAGVRRKGFDNSRPPLFCVALIRWDDTTYRVAWTLRRALLDWRSISTLLRELFANYRNILHGRNKDAAALIPEQPSWPDPAMMRTDPEFWSDYLADCRTTCLDLPPPAGTVDDDCAICEVEERLDAVQSDSVRRLGKAAGVTLNNVAQSAWAVLLSHYSRTDDVVFGVLRSCRRAGPPGLEDAVGSFLNVLPLRAGVSEDCNVFELLWRLRDENRKVREHEGSRLADIVQCAGQDDVTGLFQTVLEFDLRDPMAALDELLGDEDAWGFRHYSGPVAGLHLQVYGERQIVLRLKHDPAFMDAKAAKSLLAQYARLITGTAHEPWMHVRDVPYLDEDERAPVRWSVARDERAEPEIPACATLAARFETRAAATPDSVAVRCREQSMTYAELNAAANRLANRLRGMGARPDKLVGLCVERSLQQVIGILGILKSGAAYLPLDPAYPQERLRFQLDDADVDLVVACAAGREALDGCELDLVEPVSDEFDDAGDASNPEPVNEGSHLAYVIYTSGSTGQPKGVMVTHHNVTRLFDANAGWLKPGSTDVWTLFHSFAFDFSVWEIWGALLHGGCLEVVSREVARSPEAFHDLLVERGVTVLNQTPSSFRQLMQVDTERKRALPALRMIVFGGEKLDFTSLRDWVQRHGSEKPRLINMYGITETTVHVTCRPLTESDVETSAPATGSMIGWPLPDLYVRLLDERGRPVPPGVRGEICVGGAGVARGYLNRPKLTAAKFVRDRFSGEQNARLYRSGDFARIMPNGELCYLGREDDQVKIRGFRIDLGEIAAALRTLESIDDAIVVPRESTNGDRRLFAYYTSGNAKSHEQGSRSESELRAQLARRLPDHMLPAQLIHLRELPMNANNKVDLRALPDPADIAGRAEDNDLPQTPAEDLLVNLWKQVLERRDVGRTDDFFGLGGDSILALQLVSRVRAAGVDILPRDVFNHPVLADMAANAGSGLNREFEKENDVDVEGSWTLTPIQRWFFEQGFDNPDHWNEAFMFRVPPDTDVDLLERALLEVVRNHDALHVRFVQGESGQWHAEPVKPEEALEFSRIELDHLDEDERLEAANLITAEIQGSLAVSAGLLVRAAHFTGGLEDGARLLIVVHQLAIDAASWSILLQDLDAAYRSLASGEEPGLPSPTCSYGRWAKHLRRQAESASVAGEYAYWQRVMQAGDESPLRDAVLEPGREADARTHRVALDAPETAALLGNIHHAYGTEVHELLIAALSRAVADQWPQNGQLRLDLERHGRNDEFDHLDASRTLGWFTNLHPLALNQAIARNPGRLICDVKTRLRSAPHHGAGWGLLRYLRSSGSTGFGKSASQRAPILFNYLGHFERVLDNGMFQHVFENVGAQRGLDNRLTHPLAITALIHDDRMEFEFRYGGVAIADAVVESLAARFMQAIKDLIHHCRTLKGITRAPVDFPLAHLGQEELDNFPMALDDAEDILALSPLQRLYHALFGTDKDVGFDQWVFHLQGHIDETAFESAWQELFRRHDALRTIFVDDGLAQAHQVVLREVPFRLQRTDWRLLDETAQQQRLEEFLAADRRQGFEADVAPLTRATLIRAADDRWILVWSHHQALVDGWSWPVMARELGELHDAIRDKRKPELLEPGSYRSYIAWWMDRDRSDYARFWRNQLGGGALPRSLITRSRRKGDGNAGPRSLCRTEILLSEASSRGVAKLARKLRLTPSVIFQAAWALLLSALTRRFDVTMGVAFSGRTAGIPVPAHTVGPFVNDLPVRVRIGPTQRLDHWLADLRSMQADLNHYQNVSPLEVHEWSGMPAGTRLFDTLIVFQNYATGDATRRWGRDIQLERFSAGVRTNYPLTVAVTPGNRYRIEFHYDSNAIDADAVNALAADLETIVDTMTRTPDVHIATIINHLAGHPANSVESDTGQARQRSGDGKWMRRASDRERPIEAPAGPADEAPQDSEIQQQVAAICREVIGMDDLDVQRNFFDIGAQSVSLLEIHGRLQKRLKRRFPIVRLFQYPTISALSRYLESGDNEVRGSGTVSRAAQQRAALQRRRAMRQTGGIDR